MQFLYGCRSRLTCRRRRLVHNLNQSPNLCVCACVFVPSSLLSAALLLSKSCLSLFDVPQYAHFGSQSQCGGCVYTAGCVRIQLGVCAFCCVLCKQPGILMFCVQHPGSIVTGSPLIMWVLTAVECSRQLNSSMWPPEQATAVQQCWPRRLLGNY